MRVERKRLIYNKKHQCLAFADNLVIWTRSKQEVIEVVKRLKEWDKKVELYINEQKMLEVWERKILREIYSKYPSRKYMAKKNKPRN